VTISASIQKLRLDQQEKVVKVMDHWVDEWEKKTKDPDYVPALDCVETTSTHLMEFVDQVLPGLDEFFICHQKWCSTVCLSVDQSDQQPSKWPVPLPSLWRAVPALEAAAWLLKDQQSLHHLPGWP
jgi:hypothetical protein